MPLSLSSSSSFLSQGAALAQEEIEISHAFAKVKNRFKAGDRSWLGIGARDIAPDDGWACLVLNDAFLRCRRRRHRCRRRANVTGAVERQVSFLTAERRSNLIDTNDSCVAATDPNENMCMWRSLCKIAHTVKQPVKHREKQRATGWMAVVAAMRNWTFQGLFRSH